MNNLRIVYRVVSSTQGPVGERRADPIFKYDLKGRVLTLEELPERGRLVRKRFEDCFRACLARKLCHRKLGIPGRNIYPDTKETQLRPNSRNLKKLRKLLRQDDCGTNPYLKWGRAELVTALTQRQIMVPRLKSMSRFVCRMALEEADRKRTFQLMDLPNELRIMVYKHALFSEKPIVVKDATEPALLLVSRQVHQEASPIFFQINKFELRVESHDNKFQDRMGLTRLAGKELRWLRKIGSANVAKIRNLSFVQKYTFEIWPVDIYLSHLQASQCVRTRKRDGMCDECNASTRTTIAAGLQDTVRVITNWFTRCSPDALNSLLLRVKKTKNNIKGLQDAMDTFAAQCGTGIDVTPTVEGIELLASAMF
jgi:hypothetical protein